MSDSEHHDLPAVPDAVTSPGDAPSDPLAGALGGLDLSSLMDMAGQMQQQMEAAQSKAASTEVVGTSGGGAVRVTATGSGEFQSVVISPDVVGDDIEMLQDLVLAAVRDAMEQVQGLQNESMGALGGAVGGLGNLGDLFGG